MLFVLYLHNYSNSCKMKLKLKNLGKITQSDFETNDLTVIVGPNNAGKTYVTYTLYGLLKNHKDFINYNLFDVIINSLYENGNYSLDESELSNFTNNLFQHKSNEFNRKFSQIFNDSEDIFRNTEVEVNFDLPTKFTDNKITAKIGRFNHLELQVLNNGLSITLSRTAEITYPKYALKNFLISLLFRLLNLDYLFNANIITAERIGITLFYKELDEARNLLVDKLQKLSINKEDNEFFELTLDDSSAYYSIPIRDHIKFTRSLEDLKKLKTTLDLSYSLSILKEMIGGEFKKEKEIRFLNKRIKINKFDIPLHLSSSSTRCIVDLYFYLKHVASENQFLIIDEPESHFTLRNQRLMAKLIVSLVNSGIKVLITTHSEFLIKELNNFILLNGDFKEKTSFLKKNKFYNIKDNINYSRINFYHLDKGVINKVPVSKNGINVDFFDEEITELFRISSELLYLNGE